MTSIRVAAGAAALILLSPVLAHATQCRTASGVVFEAPAAAASAFTMAVKSCAPAAVAVAPGQPAALSPLLRIYERPNASTDIRIRPAVAPSSGRERLTSHRRSGRGQRVTGQVAYAPTAYRMATGMAVAGVARAYDIDPELLGSVVGVESGANPYARSPKGALGLMQVMPGTARRFGVSAPVVQSNPVANLAVGAAYLKSLQRLYGNNLPLILAAYNAGEGAVARHHRSVPPYRETTGYVGSVLGRYRNAIYARAYPTGGWRVASAR